MHLQQPWFAKLSIFSIFFGGNYKILFCSCQDEEYEPEENNLEPASGADLSDTQTAHYISTTITTHEASSSSTKQGTQLILLYPMKRSIKVKRCYSRFHIHVLDYCQWLRMPDDLPILDKNNKRFELWGIRSTSGHFRPYQIQIANIHFKFSYSQKNFSENSKLSYTISKEQCDRWEWFSGVGRTDPPFRPPPPVL